MFTYLVRPFTDHLLNTNLLLIVIALLFAHCGRPTELSEGLPYDSLSEKERRLPENALTGLQIADDLQATLFAAEPMVVNPTNMDIDHRGRVWVCEGYNYRPNRNPKNPTKAEGDRIIILEDTDGDGKADANTVFYQGNDVNAALGIWVMDNKAIVSCSPNVLLLTDTDGDDKADKKEVLFSGLGGEQHDHAIHAFVFGPDGKMYFNFGNAGGQILDKDGKPVIEQTGTEVNNLGEPYRQGMVFRCDPDGSNFEVLGHNFRNNYEVAVDSYGTLWQSDNDDDGNKGVRINYVMEYGNYGYRDEMTGENWRAYRTGMHDEIPKRHWHLNDPGVVPNLLQTGAGSPTGILVYEGKSLPERFHNQVIHSDAGPNVVRSYPVEKSGAGYTADIDNIVKGRDQWFRPADVTVAPDGSLFIADWYDPGVGGHQVGDLAQGRIFRVTKKPSEKSVLSSLFGSSEPKYQVDEPKLSSPEGAVEALSSPNLSTRYLAWNRLHKWGTEAEPALKKMTESEDSRMRARAYWLLSKIKGLGEKYVDEALDDSNPDIRIAAIRMARQQEREMLPILEQMSRDKSMQVKREVALALRYLEGVQADDIWANLALQHDGNDRWYLESLGIGADVYTDQRFRAWMNKVGDNYNNKAGQDIIWRIRSVESIPLLAELIKSSVSNTYNNRLRYFRAFDFHSSPTKQAVLADMALQQHENQGPIGILALNHLDKETVKNSPKLKKALKNSLDQIKGTNEYIELIKRYQLKEYKADLLALATQSTQVDLAPEAAKLLLEMGGSTALDKVLSTGSNETKETLISTLKRVNNEKSLALLKGIIRNQNQPIEVREAAVMSFAGSWGGENMLLDMVRGGDLHADLDSVAIVVFSRAMRNAIYEEASVLMGLPGESQEGELPSIKTMVAMQGDVANGSTVFEKACQNCHVVDGKGIDYGPGLSEIGAKLTKDALYKSILNPSEGISFGYEGYQVELADGNQVIGYILSQTEDELQLRVYGGLTNTYAMSEISDIKEFDQSLMFDNLERSMSQQELVDLVEYLSSLKGSQAVSMN